MYKVSSYVLVFKVYSLPTSIYLVSASIHVFLESRGYSTRGRASGEIPGKCLICYWLPKYSEYPFHFWSLPDIKIFNNIHQAFTLNGHTTIQSESLVISDLSLSICSVDQLFPLDLIFRTLRTWFGNLLRTLVACSSKWKLVNTKFCPIKACLCIAYPSATTGSIGMVLGLESIAFRIVLICWGKPSFVIMLTSMTFLTSSSSEALNLSYGIVSSGNIAAQIRGSCTLLDTSNAATLVLTIFLSRYGIPNRNVVFFQSTLKKLEWIKQHRLGI